MDIAVTHNASASGAGGKLVGAFKSALKGLHFATPAVDLAVRLVVASAFFKSGLVKIASWDATLYLFEYEYQVPLLPPDVAAYLSAGAELGLPVLLALGLGTRFAALALFLVNIVAVISYPGLSEAGLKDHQYWGLFMLVTLFHGPGKLSLDYLIRRKFFPEERT